MDNTNIKKADNTITNYKERINKVDDELDAEKKKLRKLDQMQNNIDNLSESINKCIYLLSQSMKGPGVDNMFADMNDSNKLMHMKASTAIESEYSDTNKKIYNLYGEKDKIIKERRSEYYKKEEYN